ncbi:lysylphosphatidylglycerol synthase transmembrane domain-containing protein [Mycoplasma sp. E35C]|uniref:lysylphosphatidylglycerol synthase transmembrane domain-containing protein n=1 Tax=Mycoplasma sp. E35C TaxID=2801918 RepID=UPI0021040C89|nr:lysylphosphatidylglycerol synthase transmembrane domain-containing protein [Mycoplasma sp. E35C]QZX48985.1 flippase-like domain-containing protein [Mycoplasma sp. E35C]
MANTKIDRSKLNIKRISITIVGVVVLLIAVLTVIFLKNTNFAKIFKILESPTNKIQLLFVALIFTCMVYGFLWQFLTLFIIARNYKIKAKWYEWIIYALVSTLINNVTPFATGAEPYKVYWLVKNKVKLSDAITIVGATAIYWSIVQITVTWPSFIYISTKYDLLSQSENGLIAYWFTFCGMIVDFGIFSFFATAVFSEKFHLLVFKVVNKLRKLLKLKPLQETDRLDYVNQKQMFIKEFKRVGIVIFMFLFTASLVLFQYSSIYMSLKILNSELANAYHFVEVFNFTNISVTANNFIPIPGAEGTIQFTLELYFKSLIDKNSLTPELVKYFNSKTMQNDINDTIFLWRFILFYLPTMIGIIPGIAEIVQYIKSIRTPTIPPTNSVENNSLNTAVNNQ